MLHFDMASTELRWVKRIIYFYDVLITVMNSAASKCGAEFSCLLLHNFIIKLSVLKTKQ